MHYQLYLPGVGSNGNDRLIQLGLGQLLRGGAPEWQQLLEPGPDGQTGSLCAWAPPKSTFITGLWPEMIEWTPCPPYEDSERKVKKGDYWIGLHRESRVTPEDVVRPERQPGSPAELADGHAWEIPVARLLHHHNGVDKETGKFARKVAPEFAAYSRATEKHAFQIFQELDQVEWLKSTGAVKPDETFEHPIELEDTWSFACQALAINYRLFPALISELELLDDRSMIAIVLAAIELPLLNHMRAQKKTEFPTPLSIPVG